MKRGLKYRIPLLRIQHTLLIFDENPHYRSIQAEIVDYCKRNRNTKVFVSFDLEKQWYPVIHTNDRWLADLVIRRYIELCHDKRL